MNDNNSNADNQSLAEPNGHANVDEDENGGGGDDGGGRGGGDEDGSGDGLLGILAITGDGEEKSEQKAQGEEQDDGEEKGALLVCVVYGVSLCCLCLFVFVCLLCACYVLIVCELFC